MSRKSTLKIMMDFVQNYLDGKSSRLDFDLDFNHYLNDNFANLEWEVGDLADCFAFYLAEEGYDKSHGLSDAAHMKLIKEQYEEFLDAMQSDIL